MPYEPSLPPRPHRGRMTSEEEQAYVSSLNEDQRVLWDEKQAQRTQVNGRKGGRPRRSDLESDVSNTELREILRYIFEALGLIFDSSAEWTDDEFNSIARGFVIVINRVPFLKVVVRALAPVTSVAQLIRKVRKLLNGRKPKQQQNTAT